MKRLPVSPKAMKRMVEVKPALSRPTTPAPPRVLQTMDEIEEAAFGKKLDKKTNKSDTRTKE